MTEDPMLPQPLCRLDEIADGGSAGFTATVHGALARILVVRKGLDVYIYLNSCPHIHAPLDFVPGQFLNLDKTLISCSTHGALFQIVDGHCLSGPCVGKHLTKVACAVRGGAVWIE